MSRSAGQQIQGQATSNLRSRPSPAQTQGCVGGSRPWQRERWRDVNPRQPPPCPRPFPRARRRPVRRTRPSRDVAGVTRYDADGEGALGSSSQTSSKNKDSTHTADRRSGKEKTRPGCSPPVVTERTEPSTDRETPATRRPDKPSKKPRGGRALSPRDSTQAGKLSSRTAAEKAAAYSFCPCEARRFFDPPGPPTRTSHAERSRYCHATGWEA